MPVRFAMLIVVIVTSTCPAALVVTWVGPLTPPVQGIDYTVTGDPPDILLLAKERSGVAVDAWIIGRVTDGPSPEPADIGSVTTAFPTTGNNFDVTIQVGRDPEFIEQTACRNLGNIDIARQASTRWSNIVLYLEAGGGVTRVRCYPNTLGEGGGLSGSVQGYSRDISACSSRASTPATSSSATWKARSIPAYPWPSAWRCATA